MWTKKDKLIAAAVILAVLILYFALPLRLIPADYADYSCTECRIAGVPSSMTDEKAGKILDLLKDCRTQGTLTDYDSIPGRPDIYIVFELKNSVGMRVKVVELAMKQTDKEEYYYSRGRILTTFAARIINGKDLYQMIMEIMNGN